MSASDMLGGDSSNRLSALQRDQDSGLSSQASGAMARRLPDVTGSTPAEVSYMNTMKLQHAMDSLQSQMRALSSSGLLDTNPEQERSPASRLSSISDMATNEPAMPRMVGLQAKAVLSYADAPTPNQASTELGVASRQGSQHKTQDLAAELQQAMQQRDRALKEAEESTEAFSSLQKERDALLSEVQGLGEQVQGNAQLDSEDGDSLTDDESSRRSRSSHHAVPNTLRHRRRSAESGSQQMAQISASLLLVLSSLVTMIS